MFVSPAVILDCCVKRKQMGIMVKPYQSVTFLYVHVMNCCDFAIFYNLRVGHIFVVHSDLYKETDNSIFQEKKL